MPRACLEERAGGFVLAYTPVLIAFSPDGSLVVVTSRSGGLARVFAAADGAPLGEIRAEGLSLDCGAIAISPNGRRLAICDGDRVTVSRAHRKQTSELSLGANVSRSVFSPDGRSLAFACEDHTVVVYNARRLTETARFRGGAELSDLGLSFTDDSRAVVVRGTRGALLYSLDLRALVDFDDNGLTARWREAPPLWYVQQGEIDTAGDQHC